MRQISRLIFISGLFFALIFSYQNCSVYKSEGRKFLESDQVSASQMAENGQSFAKIDDSSCEQYLSKSLLSELLASNETSIRSFADVENMALHCMYGLEGEDILLDHLSCSFSSEHHVEVNFPQSTSELLYKNSVGSILYVESPSEEGSCFLVGPEIGQIGAKCCAELSKESVSKNKDLFLSLFSEVLKNIR